MALMGRSAVTAASESAASESAASENAASEHFGQVTFGGLAVPGATVTATQGEKTVATSTGPDGVFRFADLADGVWSIKVEMIGFAPVTREVTVAPTPQPAAWDLRLLPYEEITRGLPPPAPRPAATDQAASPGTIVGRTATSGETSGTANGFRRAEVKANPRASAAAASAPAPEPPADASAAADGFVINGSVNNGAASPFAQSAAFGNNRRGGRSLYNFAAGFVGRTSALDARPYSFSSNEQVVKPDYNNFQISGTFGGPVRLPWVSPNKRLNVTIGYQHTNDTNARTGSTIVPTLLERAGDFSQSRDAFGQPVRPIDPATGAPFANGTIPAGQMSAQARALLPYFPEPNVTGASGFNYEIPLVSATRSDGVQTRLAQPLTSKDQLMGTLQYQRTSGENRSLLNFTDESRGSNFDATITWFRRMSLFGSLRPKYQFTQATSRTIPYFSNRTNVSGDAGIFGNDQDPLNWGPPTIAFGGGIAALTDADYAFTRTRSHSTGAEMFLNHRSHNLTFGGDVTRRDITILSQQNPRGAFTFAGTMTGSGFGDFLLGIPTTTAIATGNADKLFRSMIYDAYITDDLRLTPSLTVNLGVRWEYEAPITEGDDRLVNLDVASGFTTIAPVLASAPTGSLTGTHYRRSLLRTDRTGIQPRLALAWRPVPGSSLVVRAGYGIYRNTNVYQPIATLMAQQPPLSKTFTLQNDPNAPVTMATAFLAPTGPNTNTNTFAVDPNFRVGASQNWQASVQRDLPASLTVTASYLGTKGSNLMQEFLPNTYPAGAVNPCPTCPSGFIYLTSNGSSTRNAAQLQIRRRMRNGFTAQVQYTLAKATDNAGAFSGASLSASSLAQDWRNLDAERGPSSFDQRHLVAAQVQYSSGVGIGGGALIDGLWGKLLKGWTLTSQLTTGSGTPFTPYLFAPIAGTGITGLLRPSLTGVSLNAPDGRYLNPAAYTTPAPGEWGNVGRNSARGPSQFSLNAAAARSFTLGERLNLEWRIDATNILNRVTYAGVTGLVGSPQFGLPATANEMRKLQTTLRFRF